MAYKYKKRSGKRNKMNPSQSSIYRDLELLMLWYLPVGNKLPKARAVQYLGDKIQENIMDAMTACAIALNTSDMASRLELIDMMVWHLTTCKSAFKVLHEWTSKDRQKVRVITEVECLNFTERMNSLKRQIGGWRKKTAESLKASMP